MDRVAGQGESSRLLTTPCRARTDGGDWPRRLRREDTTWLTATVEVDSIDDTIAAAVEAGGTVVLEKTPIDERSWWAAILDTEGNHIGLYEGTTGE